MREEVRQASQDCSARLALITGASSGLGLELCHLLISQGYTILATSRTPPPCPVGEFLSADLSEPDARKKVVAWIHQHTPDLLINNAGFGLYGDVLQHPTKSTLEILEVNANAALELTLEAAKALRAQNKKGTILNVSSVAAFYPYPSFAIYAAAKACVNHFSQALDREFKPYGIRVLTACPGKIATSFQQRASQGRFLKHEPFTMSPQKAARLIWKQIEKQKPLYVFDWPYRLALSLTACLPKCLVQQLLPKKH